VKAQLQACTLERRTPSGAPREQGAVEFRVILRRPIETTAFTGQ